MTLESLEWADTLSEAGTGVAGRVIPGVVRVQNGRHGTGAGTIWTSDGAVLTNHHVVGDNREVEVALHDDRTFRAEVVARSRRLDLAFLRLRDAPDGLTPAPVGDPRALRVGELVFAVGNPWGLRGTLTAGIVSSTSSASGRGRSGYIQSDVALAPGNSGGPLVNAWSEVVGINAMISGGLALSIPADVADEWARGSHSPQPRLGISLRPIGRFHRGRWRYRRSSGLLVVAVEDGALASRAGILVGDVLVEINGEPVAADLPEVVVRSAGETLRLRISRGGETLKLDVTVPAPGP